MNAETVKEKYQKYAPYFENLYENKIIYYGRVAMIVRLEDLEVTEEYFQATAIREHFITDKPKLQDEEKVQIYKKWEFRGSWEMSNISENPLCITHPYAGFAIYLEPDFVKYIEKLRLYGDIYDGLKLLR